MSNSRLLGFEHEQQELVWLPKSIASKLEGLVDGRVVEAEIDSYFEKSKNEIASNIEMLDEMVIEYTENTGAYFIQMTRGDSGAAGLAAGTYTELVYESDSVGQKASGIIRIQTGRAPAGSKLWARCMCPGQNTSEFKFYIGIHEYEG